MYVKKIVFFLTFMIIFLFINYNILLFIDEQKGAT